MSTLRFRRHTSVAMATAIVALAACGSDPAAPPSFPPGNTPLVPTTRTFSDAAYGALAQHRLDVYLPATGNGPFPLVIWVHGGGWRNGDKALEAAAPQRRVLAAGYALASVGYRLSSVALWPAQIHDVKAAVRHLRANAAQYFVDTARFGAWGSSAGGHLVSLLGTSGGNSTLEGASLGNAAYSSRVKAVVDWFGPIDFNQMDPMLAAIGCHAPGSVVHGGPNSPEAQLLGAPIGQVPALVAQANPVTYVTPDDPPFFIQHGTADCSVPRGQSEHFRAVLAGAGGIGAGNVSLSLITGAGHGGAQFQTTANINDVIAFFDRTIR